MNKTEKKEGIERRDFLRSTAAASAGLMLAPMITERTEAADSGDDINVALLGAGRQGQVLVASCMKIPGLRFKAVCDIWTSYNQVNTSRRLKAYKHENNTYTDYREMLDKEKDLDAVIIATPDFWHAEHAIACMEAGLDVYCEKEMSNTLEGAKSMVEAQKKTGKLLQIGHQRRSNPRYIHCYDKIIQEAGLLGDITTINGQWNRAYKPDFTTPDKYAIDQATLTKYGFKDMHQFGNWRWYKGLGGGPIVDLGSHQIDIFSWFLGCNPKSVLASGGSDFDEKGTHEWYDTVMAIYEYETDAGTVRAFYQTLTTNSNGGYFESFMGKKGTLQISESNGRGEVFPEPSADKNEWASWVKNGVLSTPKEAKQENTGAVLDVRESPKPPSYKIPVTMEKKYHQPHLENFFDSIRGKAELNCPAKIGYETAVAVLKVNEAVEAAKKLSFDESEFDV
jgi:predicted dehydrogenase